MESMKEKFDKKFPEAKMLREEKFIRKMNDEEIEKSGKDLEMTALHV